MTHWCMYVRDTGYHAFSTNWKGKTKCSGCGVEKEGK